MPVNDHLGLRSEYVINHQVSDFIEQNDVIVFRTAEQPDYYFGNLLALKEPLDSRTPAQWQERFREAFSELPGVRHCTLQWIREDPQPVNVERFKALGFQFEENHILALNTSKFRGITEPFDGCSFRPLQSAEDWSQWIEMNIADQLEHHTEAELRPYLNGRVRNYQALSQRRLGETLGAFDGAELIGYAGLYHLNDLGRFQNVQVNEDRRNQGIARTLLTHLVERLPEGVDQLVIVADEHYHASALYQRLGFQIAERECSLCWWPKS